MYDFSVIMPTHNRSDYLREAVRSILAQQVCLELIIVDDASTDDTPAVVQEMIRENEQENIAIVYLRNDKSLFANGSRQRGYLAARGKYIIFMDDDDFYVDNCFFADAKGVLDTHAQVNSVLGATVGFCDGQYEAPMDLCGNGIIPNREYVNNFVAKYSKPQSTLTAVFRKEALDAVNLADCEMINDTCIYLWGTLNGDVYLINRPVAAYRFHSSNISNSKFAYDFIMGTLNEKLKVYEYAQKAQKLNDRKAWLNRHLGVSVCYFLRTNRRDMKSVCGIISWFMIHGHGVQLDVCKKIIREVLHKI